jgi:CubicO group peptidase (beta-lactamase class C family)
MTIERILQRITSAALVTVVVATPGSAQVGQATEMPVMTEDQSAEAEASPLDPVELEAFIDGMMRVQLRHLKNVGATISVVQGGEVILAKGYGFADLEGGVEVDPVRTLFRIGSVTKLFVWTSVMQLVESGQLDLDADINEYLETFEIPAVWDEPVTMAHLMTHTPGFEDRVVGLFARDASRMQPIEEVLAGQTPERVRPPGDHPSYSNHGTAMAARIVENITGQDFQDYVQENILDPLGMANTTLAQPLPEHLAEQMSKGYERAGDHYEEQDFEFVPLYPAGSVSSSATDMARLMIAFLQKGQLGGNRILSEETAMRMRSAIFEVAPGVNTSPHGFMDMSTRGVRIIGHGGDTLWFHTLFSLYPERDLGLFVSYNTDTGGGGRGILEAAFLDRYFAEPERSAAPSADFSERADLFAGEYRGNRFPHTTLAKLGAAAEAFKVTANEEGELLAMGNRWVETSPGIFTSRSGEATLVFVEGEDGRMSHFYMAQFPIMTFGRVPASEARGIHLPLLVLSLVMFVFTVVAWPLGWAIRKWFRVGSGGERLSSRARLMLWATTALMLALLIGLGSVLSDVEDIVMGDLGSVKMILLLPLIALLPAAGSIVAMIGMWRASEGTTTGRVLYSLTVVLVLTFYWQMSVWNVLGFQL